MGSQLLSTPTLSIKIPAWATKFPVLYKTYLRVVGRRKIIKRPILGLIRPKSIYGAIAKPTLEVALAITEVTAEILVNVDDGAGAIRTAMAGEAEIRLWDMSEVGMEIREEMRARGANNRTDENGKVYFDDLKGTVLLAIYKNRFRMRAGIPNTESANAVTEPLFLGLSKWCSPENICFNYT